MTFLWWIEIWSTRPPSGGRRENCRWRNSFHCPRTAPLIFLSVRHTRVFRPIPSRSFQSA
ncbi:TPA_asm: UL20 iORF [Human alphaherpesvirus 1]|nr:TPA_asm: UL20 iORF [Human alphaherpesvirus 1]